jgi:hypothetical protein
MFLLSLAGCSLCSGFCGFNLGNGFGGGGSCFKDGVDAGEVAIEDAEVGVDEAFD